MIPMKIPFLKALFGSEEIEAAVRVMGTKDLVKWGESARFENQFAEYTGVNHAVSCNSGTTALELVFKSLIIDEVLERGDKVVLPSFTFIGVANAVVNAGLRPVFADISEDYTIDPFSFYQSIDNDDDIKAVIAVHTYGKPCKMDEILKIAYSNDIILIEDCAEACGAEYKGKKVGSFGDAGIFSFNATKNMTAGGGGMVVTDDMQTAQTIRLLKDNGVVRTGEQFDSVLAGGNHNLNNIQAAIGIEQLKKLDKMNDRRIENALKLSELLSSVEGIQTPIILDKHVFQLYTVRLNSSIRNTVLESLKKCGIEAKVYFDPPVHMQSFYKNNYPCSGSDLSNTMEAARSVITLPMYPGLTEEEIEYMASMLKEVIPWCS